MTGGPIRILLVDDHALFRAGLRSLLSREADMAVVGEAPSGSEAIALAGECRPDVILMDISMPDMGGLEATQEVTRCLPGARVIILTLHEDRQYLLPALRAGAVGYMIKHADAPDLLAAIRAVVRGERFLHSAVTGFLIEQCIEDRSQAEGSSARGQPLSERESEVLRMIARGLSYKEMALLLGVSKKTVATYRDRIKEKLDVCSRADFVRLAVDRGLLYPEG